MSKYYSLPSIYLGSSDDGETLYKSVKEVYQANQERFSSYNVFLKHLLGFAIQNDKTLKHPKTLMESQK